jgi:preprotein translocase subunit SecE
MKPIYEKLVQFLKEVQMELGKVSWPSRQELTVSTAAVVVFSIVLAGFIGILDYVLVRIVETVAGL